MFCFPRPPPRARDTHPGEEHVLARDNDHPVIGDHLDRQGQFELRTSAPDRVEDEVEHHRSQARIARQAMTGAVRIHLNLDIVDQRHDPQMGRFVLSLDSDTPRPRRRPAGADRLEEGELRSVGGVVPTEPVRRRRPVIPSTLIHVSESLMRISTVGEGATPVGVLATRVEGGPVVFSTVVFLPDVCSRPPPR